MSAATAKGMSAPKLPFTGSEYLESLRDEREVWIFGQRVKDVTTHPAFATAPARSRDCTTRDEIPSSPRS
jgi:hypothetical protein